MKKVLIATTALVLSAGVAAADVTISGYGRTGVDYQEDRGFGLNDSQIISRLRMNLDASSSSDQGVEFGARFRMQWDQNSSARGEGGTINAGKLWIRSSGMTVSVGNVDGAFDTAAGLYNGELGYQDRSFGDPHPEANFFSYTSSKYSNVNRLGVNAAYDMGPYHAELSYIDPDQTGANEAGDGFQEEIAMNLSYDADVWGAAFGAAKDGGGQDNNDLYYLGGWYNFNDRGMVGVKWIDNGEDGGGNDIGNTVTLYGTYEVAPLTTVIGYVANNDYIGNVEDTVYGIGAQYDLGGARLAGGIEKGFDDNMRADMGLRFDF